MADLAAMRRSALAGVDLSTATAAVSLHEQPFGSRFILRGRPAIASAAQDALGFALPLEACRAAGEVRRFALWLGPDEWLLLMPEADEAGPKLGAALAGLPHALVDIGERQAGLRVSGPRAADALNAGCPLDLHEAAFPVGMCTRTLLGKAEVVLWRRAPDLFHLEVWRSFARYAVDFLREAARGL